MLAFENEALLYRVGAPFHGFPRYKSIMLLRLAPVRSGRGAAGLSQDDPRVSAPFFRRVMGGEQLAGVIAMIRRRADDRDSRARKRRSTRPMRIFWRCEHRWNAGSAPFSARKTSVSPSDSFIAILFVARSRPPDVDSI